MYEVLMGIKQVGILTEQKKWNHSMFWNVNDLWVICLGLLPFAVFPGFLSQANISY